jgi:threonine aldolase
MTPIDLRSDTLTRPTQGMLEAMRTATAGDDSRDGDPTVVELETVAARLTGKEAAAFMPSGTMTNLAAVLAHCPRGGEVIIESSAHIMNTELGGISALGGLFPRPVPGVTGMMDAADVQANIRQMTRNNMGTSLICVETSHNAAGGTVPGLTQLEGLHRLATQHAIPVHIDGARLFNAAVYLKTSPATIAAHCESVCFCISKGLSAPIGSLLCGETGFIERTRAIRRMLGGSMRQAGSLAAAGLIAVDTMVERLEEDHVNARKLGVGLHAIEPRLVDLERVQTNIVRVEISFSGRPAQSWASALQAYGIRVSPAGQKALRFVTHRHVSSEDIDTVLDAFRNVHRQCA